MAQQQSSPAPQTKTSVIASGTVITGNFKTSENLRVDGKVVGDVVCEKRLVIGATGHINGTVKAAEMTMMGKLEGTAEVASLASLGATADFKGKIMAVKLEMEEGAMFNGEFSIGQKKERNHKQTATSKAKA